ncbi:MAG: phenylalanine--tRNA ligase subunit alpha [Elusimicrobia bacterium]|nr:phenylalanine--tRNA ligase subunit alpha [Elusimicrobiota bacterium]
MPEPRDWDREWLELSAGALDAVSRADTLEAVEAARVDLLGRERGRLSALLKSLKDLPIEERKRLGPQANALKDAIEKGLESRRKALDAKALDAGLAAARIDLSLPPPPWPRGRRHPVSETLREMTDILSRLGFALAEGPLVENDRNNFEGLNIPADHPARDVQDTFYLRDLPLLLRTHTSPVQIRHMEANKPPIRIMAPGRVFRHEAVDASHSAVFHQVEGLYIDRRVTMADLKGTLSLFMRGLLGPKAAIRFRPSFFPFTEPSTEVDVRCLLCAGAGCAACKRSGWMELLGAGLVHPNVLRFCGIDPAQWSGFAFGVGVERLTLLRLGVPDIRMLYENDVRVLEKLS